MAIRPIRERPHSSARKDAVARQRRTLSRWTRGDHGPDTTKGIVAKNNSRWFSCVGTRFTALLGPSDPTVNGGAHRWNVGLRKWLPPRHRNPPPQPIRTAPEFGTLPLHKAPSPPGFGLSSCQVA